VFAAIIFQKEVRQLIWDGRSSRLFIVTAENTPSFHCWSDRNEPPIQVIPPRLKGLSSSRWAGQLLRYGSSSPIESSAQDESFFMVSSTKHFDILRLDNNEYTSIFDVSQRDGDQSPLDLTETSDNLNARHMQPASSNRTSNGSSIFF